MRLIRSLGILALLILATGCSSAAGPATSAGGSAGVAVEIRGFQYLPATLEVARGTTVTWTNRDDILHTATGGTTVKKDNFGNFDRTKAGSFDGTMDAAGKSFTFTFTEPGEYAYFCDRHPHMTGKVVVK